MVAEAEAYRGSKDPASHAFRGMTPRNSLMFGEAGHGYLYFSYGSHWCLNVTTEPPGIPGAVLIRSILPLEGTEAMLMNRGLAVAEHVADGPGKLTKALMIDDGLNGEDMVYSRKLYFLNGSNGLPVNRSPRIGVSKGTSTRWRFYLRTQAI